jgi:hypothetical protein
MVRRKQQIKLANALDAMKYVSYLNNIVIIVEVNIGGRKCTIQVSKHRIDVL